MKFSDNLSNIATALCKVQAEIKNPIKNQINNGVQGAPKYANLEDTLQEYVRPILTKHGMSVMQSIKTDETGRVGVCTVLLHESGEFIEGVYCYCEIKIPVSKQGKEILTEGQATGVNITYLRRYSLNAALGINGDKDTDGSYGDKPVEDDTLTYETALEHVLTFGKYSGETLSEVWKKDAGYISWLANGEKTDPQIKNAIALINEHIRAARKPVEDVPMSSGNIDTGEHEDAGDRI